MLYTLENSSPSASAVVLEPAATWSEKKLRSTGCDSLGVLQSHDAVHLLEGELEKLFALLKVNVLADLGVFASEGVDLFGSKVATKSVVKLTGELKTIFVSMLLCMFIIQTTYVVVELGEKFDVEEENGSGGELVCDNVEENLRAVVFVLFGTTLLRLDGLQAHLDELGSILEEDGFTT